MTPRLRSILPSMQVPRLLPVTICVLALVLAWKSTSLVRSIIFSGQPALIAAALASGSDAPPPAPHTGEQPGAKPSQPAKPEQAAEKKSGGAATPKAAEKPPAQDAVPAVTDGERAVLLELRQRRQELDAREATLAGRESMLAAADMKLSARVGELQSLQKKLEGLDAAHQQQEENAWQGLVKVYETMKPRDAATIFNELGMPVLLSVVGRMKEGKASAVLAAMVPDKAREVTTQLAQFRTRSAETADTGGKPASEPGKASGSGT
jgi:flagellar motility protein MotE (MotC chaperone)